MPALLSISLAFVSSLLFRGMLGRKTDELLTFFCGMDVAEKDERLTTFLHIFVWNIEKKKKESANIFTFAFVCSRYIKQNIYDQSSLFFFLSENEPQAYAFHIYLKML